MLQTILFNKLHLLTGNFTQTRDWFISNITSSKSTVNIVHINVFNLYILLKDADFKEKLQKSSTLIFDGIGLKLGLFFTTGKWIPDLNGTDLFPLVMKEMSDLNTGIFLLGATDEVINRTADNIKTEYPGARIQGQRSGFFKENEEPEIVDEINRSNSQLLIIGMGFKRQESFALKHMEELNVNVIWHVGGLFDFISGKKPRAPKILRKCRLEWLFRLYIEPKRMWYRYTVVNFWFICHVFKLLLKK